MISMAIADTLGPYYDTFVDALSVKFRHKQMIRLKVRLSNPPEPADPKFTIIEYSRDNSKFKEKRSYNKN